MIVPAVAADPPQTADWWLAGLSGLQRRDVVRLAAELPADRKALAEFCEPAIRQDEEPQVWPSRRAVRLRKWEQGLQEQGTAGPGLREQTGWQWRACWVLVKLPSLFVRARDWKGLAVATVRRESPRHRWRMGRVSREVLRPRGTRARVREPSVPGTAVWGLRNQRAVSRRAVWWAWVSLRPAGSHEAQRLVERLVQRLVQISVRAFPRAGRATVLWQLEVQQRTNCLRARTD